MPSITMNDVCIVLYWVVSIAIYIDATDDGEQVLVDVEGKEYKEITQHVRKILGKSE